MLTEEEFKKLDEARLRQEVVIPLLEALGYRDVFEHHGGVLEKGKDVVGWKLNELGNVRNLAIVAEATRLSGRAAAGKGTLNEVEIQVRQCFGSSFTYPKSLDEQQVHHCWVVSNKPITNEFMQAAMADLERTNLTSQIEFIDGKKLWELYKKHVLPITGKVLELRKYLDSVHPSYFPEVTVTARETTISLGEKFPGAFDTDPIEGTVRWTLADTPEGHEAHKAIEQLLTKGGEATLPPGVLQSLQLPELIEQLFGKLNPEKSQLHLQSIPDPELPPFLAKLEFGTDDGKVYTIEHVHLRAEQLGTERMLFSNEKQLRFPPVIVEVVIDSKDQTVKISTRPTFNAPINAYALLQILELLTCMSQPCTIKLYHVETNIAQFTLRAEQPLTKAPNAKYVEVIRDLAAIQSRLRVPIMIPDRKWTEDERDTIGHIRSLLHEGGFEANMHEGWMDIPISELEGFLSRTVDGHTWLRQEERMEAELFDARLPLGRRSYSWEAELANEAEIQEALSQSLDGDSIVRVKLKPVGTGSVWIEYDDWKPGVH